MRKSFLLTACLAVILALAAVFVYGSYRNDLGQSNGKDTVGIISTSSATSGADDMPGTYACDADAQICWDGSTVGRTGGDCHFAACPAPDATSSKLYTPMGHTMTGLNVSVTPKEVVSDSRCPVGVQCIWAGTVEVRAVAATQVAHGEHIFKLGEPRVFGDFTITLTAVDPQPKAGETIPVSSYRFTFEIEKR